MSVLKITLTPMEPYFLGGERNAFFEGTNNTKQSERKPYFIRSETLPSQTTLFGITRFLGIRNPKENFALSKADKDYIGPYSYQLLEDAGEFGKIDSISPLVLERQCENGQSLHYIPAPRNHITNKNPLQLYRSFESAETMDGERWVPTEYDAKEYEPSMFVCIENGEMIAAPFQTQVRVGIQRRERKRAGNPGEEKGDFFKKEYVVMDRDFSFVWYVHLKEDAFGPENGISGFTQEGQRLVFVGQGKTGFSARWENEKDAFDDFEGKLKRFFISPVTVTDQNRETEHPVWYAYIASDLYYSGELKALRQNCVFALADTRDHRSFTTNENAKTAQERYKKGLENIKLLKAGSVFLFKDEKQKEGFRKLLEASEHFAHGKTAGFNHIIYVGEETNHEN